MKANLMSVRYGVGLIPEPSFTARVYRARQLICGQYASWAAEMHMLHLSLTGFFECPDSAVDSLSAGLGNTAEVCRRRALRFPLHHRGVTTSSELPGSIHLDFTVPDNPIERHQRELDLLHRDVLELLGQTQGVRLDAGAGDGEFRPRINLMEYASLSPSGFGTAVEFARAVVRDLQVPNSTRAWHLVLLRFESAAAGDDWGRGLWAADLRWLLLDAYSL